MKKGKNYFSMRFCSLFYDTNNLTGVTYSEHDCTILFTFKSFNLDCFYLLEP